jgi:hypothetical protein
MIESNCDVHVFRLSAEPAPDVPILPLQSAGVRDDSALGLPSRHGLTFGQLWLASTKGSGSTKVVCANYENAVS